MKKLIVIFLLIQNLIFSEPILIASFNTLRLGESKKSYPTVAKILSKFDLIALQEVMNEKALIKLQKNLEKLTKEKWAYILSPSVGTKEYSEYYAYIFKKSKIDSYKDFGIYKEGKTNEFIRPAFAASFNSNKFDFVLINAHSIFGNSKKEREAEASRYHRVYEYFSNKTKEEDIILLGDFNLKASNHSFNYMKEKHSLKELLDPKIFKTTISKKGLANSYDNMFFNRNYLKEYTGNYGVYNFIDNNNELIIEYVSDHLLIFAQFENSKDLDMR